MIQYTEKGAGLHDAIRAAGHWLREENGAWVSSDDVAVQAIIDGYVARSPLDEAKLAKSAEVSLYAKRLREKVTAAIAPGEMASWSIKRTEAEDYAANGDAASCPALRAEAHVRGVTLAQLVAKVSANGVRFMGAEAAIGGTDGRHRDAISALTSIEQVTNYDFSIGWPEV